ncbi:VOC family protein [Sphingomonas sp. MMS12-HWE2-04]|uniref:VOC family protein n=1 Tax=Sphingomonas sp. MMS12-HWE2-04 TaxID=3234199 RepID=UPI00384DA81B
MRVMRKLPAAMLAIGIALAAPGMARAQEAGRVTGVGGIFVKSKDPKALAIWYRDVLGIQIEAFGGAMLRYDAPGHPSMMVWRGFKQETTYMAPSSREFMLNFTVDDMDAFVARLKAKGVPILKRTSDSSGEFAWILDPDGTKIELWEPKPE